MRKCVILLRRPTGLVQHLYCAPSVFVQSCNSICCCRIRTDHNVDNTAALIEEWCSAAKHVYTSVDCHSSSEWIYPTRDPYAMPEEHYLNVARLRQKALEAAREAEADYLLVS